jgi:RES domain-containing protein
VTPLPPPLGSGELVFWRLDQAKFGFTWDSGEGSYLVGGRWNSAGVRVVYAALDPATAILEVAVHKTFKTLDIVPHVLTSARITGVSQAHVVNAAALLNPNWLRPGAVSAGQQAFGDALLKVHPFLLIPSVVSAHSWIVIFDPAMAKGLYDSVAQEPFALDTRLHTSTGASV